MKRQVFIYLLTLAFCGLAVNYSFTQSKNNSIAFGHIKNSSNITTYNYLEAILPNTLANTLQDRHNIKTLQPGAVQQILSKSEKQIVNFVPSELKEIIEIVKTDYFAYGSFNPLPGNRIEIILNLYHGKSGSIFSFNITGKMEAEIFRLADRIVSVVIGHLAEDAYYKSAQISKNASMGFITDIEGMDLNTFYLLLGNAGYTVKAVSGNTLRNEIQNNGLSYFEYVQTERASYDITTDHTRLKYLYTTRTEKGFDVKLNSLREIYRKYDLEYLKTKEKMLNQFSRVYSIDYLFILLFNEKQTNATLRCIDLKSKELIWRQKNISGSDVAEITSKIIAGMDK